eukprot:scaffold16564_cov136-Isochrysis_galbana.AAC.4
MAASPGQPAHQLISSSERCCARYSSFGPWAFEGHGVMAHPRRAMLRGVPDARACGEKCTALQRCRFYSHDTEQRCSLCRSCELRPAAPSSAEELRQGANLALRSPRRRVSASARGWLDPLTPVRVSSWAVSRARWAQSGAVPAPVDRLWRLLDASNYTSALYGPGTSLPPPLQLRVVWLHLMSGEAVRELGRAGVCMVSPTPPERPFFSWIGIKENPWNAIWISHRFPRTAAPSHTWIEVTHCAIPAPRRTEVRHTHAWPAWKQQAMWLHAAPGSGVSINVGRTHVAQTYEEAGHLLARLLPGEAHVGTCAPGGVGPLRATPAPDGWEWHAPLDFLNGSLAARLRRRRPTLDALSAARETAAIGASDRGELLRMTGRAAGPGRSISGLSDAALEALDSIQIVRHIEFHSFEPRHEIVLLRQRECARLDAGVARCGRYPNLFPCSQQALNRIATCANAFSRPWADVPVPGVIDPFSCNRDSDCYLVGGGTDQEAYMCAQGEL